MARMRTAWRKVLRFLIKIDDADDADEVSFGSVNSRRKFCIYVGEERGRFSRNANVKQTNKWFVYSLCSISKNTIS